MKILEESGPTAGEEHFSFWIGDQYGGGCGRGSSKTAILRSLVEA